MAGSQSEGRSGQVVDVPIWQGRPSVGSFVIIYGMIALVVDVVLVTAEYLWSITSSTGNSIMPKSVILNGVTIPYPVEIVTTIIIFVAFLFKLIGLTIIWATSRYQLMRDGIYINRGVVNLENSFLSAVAFSDARLIRTWPLRLAGRGLIIIDANDERHFYLRYVKNPLEVQILIRRTLSHPTIKTEK